jgi:hypothetical protein
LSENEDTGYAAAWRPDPGDKIAGKVVAIVMGPDMGYGPYPIVTLDTSEGEQAIHAFHQILRTELAKRRPKVGDPLEVTYQGKRSPKSGNGNAFHMYRVVGGQEPEFDWASELPAGESSAGASGPPASSARATAEPLNEQDIPWSEDYRPLPKSDEPSVQERAAEKFGAEAPF